MEVDGVNRRVFITLGSAVSVVFSAGAAAQEGYHGVGHDKWHQGFYSTLKRNDGQGSCCNLMDCRPSQTLATTTKLKWTVYGRLFPTTRSTTWSRPMVALMSALQGRWGRIRALYSVSFYLRRADVSTEGRGRSPTALCIEQHPMDAEGVRVRDWTCQYLPKENWRWAWWN